MTVLPAPILPAPPHSTPVCAGLCCSSDSRLALYASSLPSDFVFSPGLRLLSLDPSSLLLPLELQRRSAPRFLQVPWLSHLLLTFASSGALEEFQRQDFFFFFLPALKLHCRMWAFSSCSAQVSPCSGFSCCGAQALGCAGFSGWITPA